MGLKPNPLDLSSFSALTLLVGSFWPVKTRPRYDYNVFGGTLSLTQSINLTTAEQHLEAAPTQTEGLWFQLCLYSPISTVAELLFVVIIGDVCDACRTWWRSVCTSQAKTTWSGPSAGVRLGSAAVCSALQWHCRHLAWNALKRTLRSRWKAITIHWTGCIPPARPMCMPPLTALAQSSCARLQRKRRKLQRPLSLLISNDWCDVVKCWNCFSLHCFSCLLMWLLVCEWIKSCTHSRWW